MFCLLFAGTVFTAIPCVFLQAHLLEFWHSCSSLWGVICILLPSSLPLLLQLFISLGFGVCNLVLAPRLTHTHTHVLCMIWLGGYSSFPLLVVDLTQAMDIICVKPFTVSLIRKRGWTIGASNLGQKLPFITDVLNLETNSLSLSLVIENLYLWCTNVLVFLES